MSNDTHDFLIGQRVMIANPPRRLAHFMGMAGIYVGDDRDSLLVRLDLNGWTCAFGADWLEPEPRTVTVALTEPEAKEALAVLTVGMDGESGACYALLSQVVQKLQHVVTWSGR